MLTVKIEPGSLPGFSLKEHTLVAIEAYVLGVRRDYHRRGVGRALFDAAEAFAARHGYAYLTVKTLAASDPDPNYAATRQFYEANTYVKS